MGRIFLLFGVLCIALPAQAAEEARIVEMHSVPAGPADDATYTMNVNLYFFRGSRWQPDDVAQRLPAVATLLAQCGIALARAQMHVIDAPQRFRSYSTRTSRELLRLLAVSRPALFFVDETLNDPPFDAETIGLANAATRPELAQTIWVAHGARDLDVALAHELVHLLSNSGEHSDDPANLMHDESSQDNTRLNAAQCARAAASGEAQRLLVRRR